MPPSWKRSEALYQKHQAVFEIEIGILSPDMTEERKHGRAAEDKRVH